MSVRPAGSSVRRPPGNGGFEELVAWQRARDLARNINALVDSEPFARRYSFRDQIQRASVSVMSNIAEGYERGGRGDFFHLLSVAKGSCAEVRSLLYVALDARYITQTQFESLREQALECSRIIGALRTAVGRQREQESRRPNDGH